MKNLIKVHRLKSVSKVGNKLKIIFAGLLFITACADRRADEDEVWKLEEFYWLCVKNNNVDSYVKLWDERFVGWPGFSDSPVGKNEIAKWIAPLHQNPEESYDYELTKKAIRSFGDVVVVHYLVRDFMISKHDGNEIRPRDVYRITHTWQRNGDTWKIITGMSGAQGSKTD